MTSSAWLQGLKVMLASGGSVPRRRPRRPIAESRHSFLPHLEALEERTLLSTFTVLNLNDSGTGWLRAAITSANSHAGADIIAFASGLHGTITLTSGELLITDSLTITGPGSSKICVSGNNASRVFDMSPSSGSRYQQSDN